VTATATRDPGLAEQSTLEAERLFEPGRATLEDVVLSLWDKLVAEGRVDCPVCGGSMSAAGGCDSCGADLS
jgi:tRNA(Ile2) C34 agmatinyltransferase TiaS